MDGVHVGRTVFYYDSTGTAKGAMITAVRDAGAGKVQLSVFEPGGAITSVDNVLKKNPPLANSWHFFDEPRYG